ncbi:MAG TPA: SCP2 sterol-binding domain-containing protein [Rhodanobacteraceae bacterium]|nr:SCP2 sterol-binding domain-containing protein [Rhodanobacteraceae bacterium]
MNEAPSNSLPPPLRALGGRLLQAALNRALALDPATREQLSKLDGRSVEAHLRGPNLRLRIAVNDGRLDVGPPTDDATLRVSATPASLLAMALDRDAQLAPGSLEISGDAQLARQVEKLLAGFEPDVEAALSGRLGATAGVPLARGLAGLVAGLKRYGREAVEDAAAWLRDEAELTPAPAEVGDFLDAVDGLDERLARLEARLRRLETPQ